MAEHYLHRLFNPRSIAVYGASDRPGSAGRELYANLKAGGFEGRLYPINPNRATVGGDPALKSAAEADGPIDLAMVVTGAGSLPDIVADGAENGIRHAVILSWAYRRTGGPASRAVVPWTRRSPGPAPPGPVSWGRAASVSSGRPCISTPRWRRPRHRAAWP